MTDQKRGERTTPKLYIDAQGYIPDPWLECPPADLPVTAANAEPSDDTPGKAEWMQAFGGVDWGHPESHTTTWEAPIDTSDGKSVIREPWDIGSRSVMRVDRNEVTMVTPEMAEKWRVARERQRLERAVLNEVRTACRVNADYEQGYLSLRQWRKSLDRVRVAQEALEAAKEPQP